MNDKKGTALKRFARDALVFLAVIFASPLWMPVRLGCALRLNDGLFQTCSQIAGILPGYAGLFFRRGFYWMCLESFSRDCSIECGTWFFHTQVRIGKGVYIGCRCSVGMCDVGDMTLIGSNVDILSGRRQHHSDSAGTPICVQGGTFEKVRIGRNAWIGNSAVIMADIGEASIIGAGSVVIKPIPPNSVAVGNPATVKKSR
jgi:acetyltransferase-like isoleucine patch superfamily enzyme